MSQLAKFCKFCEVEHPLTGEHWYRLDSYPSCKIRKLSVAKKWSSDNKEHHLELNRKWYKDNLETAKVTKNTYARNNRKKITKHTEARKKVDPQYYLSCLLRSRLNMAVRGNQKSGSAVSDLGCTIAEFRAYIETLFQPGMTWDNHGRFGWHFDHVIPLASFDLTDREQLLVAVHYTNLQPLWWEDNLSKSDKVLEPWHLITLTS